MEEKVIDKLNKICNNQDVSHTDNLEENKKREIIYFHDEDLPADKKENEIKNEENNKEKIEEVKEVKKFKDSNFKLKEDFGNIPENIYKQVIIFSKFIEIEDDLSSSTGKIIVHFNKKMCDSSLRDDIIFGNLSFDKFPSTNYFKVDGSAFLYCTSTINDKEKNKKVLVKDAWGCKACNKYTPCLIYLSVYYKYLSLYFPEELERQRNLYFEKKDIIDADILDTNIAEDIKFDIKDFPILTSFRINEIREEIDNHKYSIYRIDNKIVFKYKIINDNGGIDLKELSLPFDTINRFIRYQINNKERFSFTYNESEEAFQYLFILKLLSQDVNLYKNYLSYIKELENDTYNLNGNSFYGCVCGSDREEVFEKVSKLSFSIQYSFNLSSSYVKFTAIELMQELVQIQGNIPKFKPLKYFELKKDIIYVVTGLKEFTNAYPTVSKNYYEIERRQFEHFIKQFNQFKEREFVILAGSEIEVNNFLNLSDSFKFKFNDNKYILSDMSIDEIFNIFKDMVKDKIEISSENEKEFKEYLNFNLGIFPLRNKSLSLYLANYMIALGKFELPVNISGLKQKDFMSELDGLIGMEDIKNQVKRLYKFVRYKEALKEQNIDIEASNMHMLFTGNPGTGKTTVARIIASALFNIGVIKENKIIEVERKDLVAEYIGQTAVKTSKVIDSAMGGVLFIDEAYSLTPVDGKDFGVEAIATLIKAMEDHKDDLIIIFAGYKNEMNKFIDSNPGIASRIGYTFHFEDYSEEELLEMFIKKIKGSNFILDEESIPLVKKVLQYFHNAKNIGNGRFINKLYQLTLQKRAEIEDVNLNVIGKSSIPTIDEIINVLPDNERMITPDKITNSEKKRVSFHETGHLIVGLNLGKNNIERITIEVSASGALGYVKYNLEDSSNLKTKKDYEDEICMLLGGLASEEVNLGEFSNGGGSDLPKVCNLAKHMVLKCGMSNLSFKALAMKEDDLEVIDEINRIISSQYNRAKEIISKEKETIEEISNKLMNSGTVDKEDIEKLIKNS